MREEEVCVGVLDNCDERVVSMRGRYYQAVQHVVLRRSNSKGNAPKKNKELGIPLHQQRSGTTMTYPP
jgi:hypothetical protein